MKRSLLTDMPTWLTAKPLLLACGILVALLVIQQLRVSRAHTAEAEARAELAEVRADIADQRETFERLARATERRQRDELDGVAAIYEQRMTDAKSTADRTIADLRRGTLRLRDEWAGCETAALVSGATAGADGPDDAARLREQGAAHLVRIGEECDAQTAGLQSAIRVMQGQ